MSKEKKKKSITEQVLPLKYSVGTDISKNKFDACISVIDTNQRVKIVATKTFNNTEKGVKSYLQWTQTRCKLEIPIAHSMEATGVYYERLAWFLHRSDEYVSVVLPNKAKKYLQSIGLKTKNDKIDAKGLARMGAEQNLRRWDAPDEQIMKLRGVTRQREHLQATRTQINNQLHALKSAEFVNEGLIEQQEEILELLVKEIKKTKKMIEKIVNDDKKLKEKTDKIKAVKGLDIITISTVVAETGGFKHFSNQRQLVSYCGYDVIENQSGTHMGKTKISKKGNAHVRRILHLPAFTVVANEEPVFTNLYDRVYGRTKKKMKGYVAVQRKLLILIYTLWKTNEAYDQEHSFRNQDENPVMQSKSFSFCSS